MAVGPLDAVLSSPPVRGIREKWVVSIINGQTQA